LDPVFIPELPGKISPQYNNLAYSEIPYDIKSIFSARGQSYLELIKYLIQEHPDEISGLDSESNESGSDYDSVCEDSVSNCAITDFTQLENSECSFSEYSLVDSDF
jgi:hypothetical protein